MAAASDGPHLRSASQKWHNHPVPPNYTLVVNQDPDVSAFAVYGTQQQLDRVYRKLTIRLLPLFMVMLGLNYLDRTSLAFASIQMTHDLNFSPAVYGMASGLFFLSYCLLQVPANYVCTIVGVQRWFSSIMLLWGLIAAAFAAVKRPWQFYLLRLVLGAAEAGSFPGIWYAISLWFPPDRISFPYSLMGAAVALSQILAAPVAAALLRLDGWLGLAGWQYVFIGEGLPSVALALCLPWLLPDGPHALEGFTGMLEPQELQLLRTDYAAKVSNMKHPDSTNDTISCEPEASCSQAATAGAAAAAGAAVGAVPPAGLLQLVLHVARVWQVWYLAFCNILKDIGTLALMMWLPVMVHSLLSGADPTQLAGSSKAATSHEGSSSSSSGTNTGTMAVLVSAIPFSCAAAAVAWSGSHAQQTGRPIAYMIVANFIGGISLICFHWVVHWSRFAGFTCLVITLSCAYAASPHAPIIIAKLTVGPASVISLPAYNSVAMLGGFLGPWLMGFFVQHLGGFSVATALMGGFMVLASFMTLLLQHIMMRDPWSRAAITGIAHKSSSGCEAGEAADGYDLVYRSSSSSRTKAGPVDHAQATDSVLGMNSSEKLDDHVMASTDGGPSSLRLVSSMGDLGHDCSTNRVSRLEGLPQTLSMRSSSGLKRGGLVDMLPKGNRGSQSDVFAQLTGAQQELARLVDHPQ